MSVLGGTGETRAEARAETGAAVPSRVIVQPLKTGDRSADAARIRAVQSWLATAQMPRARLAPAKSDAMIAAALATQLSGGTASAHLVIVPDTLAAPGRADLSVAPQNIVLLGQVDSAPVLIASHMRFGAVTDLSGQTLAVVDGASPQGAGTLAHITSVLSEAGIQARLQPMPLHAAISAVRSGQVAGLSLIGEPARLLAAGLSFRDRVHLLDTRHPANPAGFGQSAAILTEADGPALIAPGERVHVRRARTWLASDAAFAETAAGQRIMAAARSERLDDAATNAAGLTLAELMAEPHLASLRLTAFGGAATATRAALTGASQGAAQGAAAQSGPSEAETAATGAPLQTEDRPAKPQRQRARQVVRTSVPQPNRPPQAAGAAAKPAEPSQSPLSALQNLLSGANTTGWDYFKDGQGN